MSIDLEAVLKDLGGQLAGQVKDNIVAAKEKLTDEDLKIVERASKRKVELLIASTLGQDVSEDEKQVDATLGFLASKASAIAKETVKRTILDVVKTAAGVALKLVVGVVLP
mgnify:CR=1 FL=1